MNSARTQGMRWSSTLLMAVLLLLVPAGVLADSGRAAPDCITQSVANLQSSVDIDPDVCLIVDLGVLESGDVFDISVVVVDDAIDLLFFDENSLQPYELGQSYRASVAQPASTEFALGAYEFHWKVPPSISAKRWYMVLDNQAHDGDAGQGDQGGQRSTVAVSVSEISQAYWTPFHDLVAVETNDFSVLLSGDDLRLDAGTTVVVSAWDMEFSGDVYLQTRAMHDRYVTQAVGVQYIDGGALQSVTSSQSFTWQVTSSLEGEELLLVVDNTDTPLGGGDGSQPLRMTVRLELAPPLTPVIVDDAEGQVTLGETITFDASTTPNRVGQQGTFVWDLDADVDSNGDGNDTNDADAQGLSVTASWSTKGTKTVHARMTAPSGEIAVATYQVTVVDTQAPVARLQTNDAIPVAGGWRANVGQAITLDCSSSTDDDAIATCAWIVDGEALGTNTSITRSWADTGTHAIQLIVTDFSGNSASTNTTLRVVDPSVPSIAPTEGVSFPTSATVGDKLSFSVVVVDEYDDPAALRVHWDLRPTVDTDGNGDPRDDPDKVGLNPTIEFTSTGQQDIVVTVFDASNNSDTYGFSINIAAAPASALSYAPAVGLLALLAVLGGAGVVGYRFWQRRLAVDLLLNRGLNEEEARAHMAFVAQQTKHALLAKAEAYAGLDQGDVRPQAEREAEAKQSEFDAIYGASGEVDQTVAFAPSAYAAPMSQASSQAAAEAAALLGADSGSATQPVASSGQDALMALMEDEVETPADTAPTAVVALPSEVAMPSDVPSVALPSDAAGAATPSMESPSPASVSGGIALPVEPAPVSAEEPSPSPAPAAGFVTPPPAPAPSLVRHTCNACRAVFELDVPAGLTQAIVACPGCGVDQTISTRG